GIRRRQSALLMLLGRGVLQVRQGGASSRFRVSGGFLQVVGGGDAVRIVADRVDASLQIRAWLLAMCVLETVMRPSLFPGRLCMRQLIGSLLLLAAVGLAPAELAAQRRPAARAAASRADRPSFGLQLDWGNDPNFGIGGR